VPLRTSIHAGKRTKEDKDRTAPVRRGAADRSMRLSRRDKPMVEMRRLQGLTSSGHLIPVPPNNPLSHTPDVPWLACLDEQYIQLDEYQYVGLTAGGCIGTQRSD
jgi:hypothetical protein